ncbi:MAG TPA: 3'-5' exonuclease [Gaiellaceae bacterium]|nr:3'-5' exonuclease [Gaiellaceae bacterium]
MAHPDLPHEQAYVDNAYACLDRMREALERSPAAGAGEVAQEALEAWASRRLVTFADAERGLCFGRMDVDGAAAPLYVGRRWVHDEGHSVLVVNWQAPAARPFYTATPVAPHGVTLRRRFRTRGREVLDISDEALDGSLEDGAAAVDDFLLEELERSRDVHMRDIVATIQADQYRLIARDPAPPLVVQGGPGTGKTAVGLHRASFLLYTHREELRRILVVGPNPTFMDYVSHVLPILGEDGVDQRAVAELVDGVEVSRADAPDVERLKADLRLADVVRRAVELRLEPRAESFEARLDGAYVRVRDEEVEPLLAEVRAELGVGNAARERFRLELVRRLYGQYTAKLGARAFAAADEVERALRRAGLTRYVDRVWPVVKPDAVVGQLLGNRTRLREAAGDLLDAGEQRLLVRRAAGWSRADVPLLDLARALLVEPPRRYGHVIVDEAQDLTPMELAMVARRMGGAFTLLGDIAQGTGPVPYDAWDELTAHLPGDAAVEELEHAYRVPREIMDFALPLLPAIASDVRPPRSYRTGAAAPRVLVAGDPLARAFAEAADLAGDDALVAVIAPASLRGDGAAGSVFDERRVPVLTPREAKGLEFDHVVVVEPAQIVDEGGATGLRELYVALTRPTKSLLVTHARELPPLLR